jgi:hypothetical protein
MSVYKLDDLILRLQNQLSDASSDYWTEDTIFNAQLDLAESILPIVQSGDFSATPFKNNISVNTLSVDDGVRFSTGDTQDIPYPGPSGISHNELKGLESDDHAQYVPVSGGMMQGNLGLVNSYIGSTSGNSQGFSFRNIDEENENILFGNKTSLHFNYDGSHLSSVKGAANAWVSFDATTDPLTIKSSFNVDKIQHVSQGKFIIHFITPVSGSYTAVTSSNGSEDDSTLMVSAACVFRKPESCGFVVQNLANTYINSSTNDLIIIGTS